MQTCDCEHEAHFEPSKRTPNNNPGHSYGREFHQLVEVKTIYGTFKVCKDCSKDCWHKDNAGGLVV